MPLNPMTGQFDYGGESYDMPTMGTGMAAEGMAAVGADIPFAFRMMESMPGITAMALFNAQRYARTMEKGGYRDVLDPSKKVSRGKLRRAKRVGAILPDGAGGVAEVVDDKRFLFGKRRNLSGKSPFVKSSAARNNPFNIRNLFRDPTVAHLSGVAGAGAYTPYQGMSMLSGFFEKTASGKAARGAAQAAGISDDTPLLSGGILGRLSTMGKVYHARSTLITKPGGRAAKRATKRLTRNK